MEKREPPTYCARAERSTGNNPVEKQTSDSPSEAAQSNCLGPTSTFHSKFASLSLYQHDKICLLDFPDEAIQVVKQAIQTDWPHGLQDFRTVHNSLELKLKGLPWLGFGSDSMHARRFIRKLFEALFDAGWILSLSTNVSKKNKDKDTLIFRYQSPPPKPRDWICVAFSKRDRLRIMDAPAELTNAIHDGIRDQIQEKVSHPISGVWEVKLKGWPWHSGHSDEVIKARRLLLRLVALLESHGFTVYASIDQKADLDSDKGETDTWHCCRPKDWEMGAPVYHA